MENIPAGEIYLDIETLRLSHEIEGGWKNIKAFGVAVAVTWDERHSFREWYEDDAAGLIEELGRFPRIVTFNGERFDFEVLRGYAPVEALYPHSLDLLADLHRKLGFRVKLDRLAHETLGAAKSGSGLDAVAWWRQGQQQKVAEYCRQDVQLLVDLVKFAREKGHVVVDRKPVPVNWS